MDILSLHLSQRTLQFGAFRRPNRICQPTVDSYTFGRNRGPPGLRARWSPQNMFRTSKHSRKKDLGGERTWKKVTIWLPWLENLWEKRAKKHAPNMQCTIQHVYMHIYNYIYNTLITSFPRGWKEHMRLSEKKIAPIYHILTIYVWFCPAIGLRYWKCLSKCDHFQREGPPPSIVAGTMDQWWRVQWKATGPATTQQSGFLAVTRSGTKKSISLDAF